MNAPVREEDAASHVRQSRDNGRDKGNESEQRTAFWTLTLSVSTVFLTVFTAGVFWYAVKQSKDTKEALKIARDNLIGEQRPWIGGPDAMFSNGIATFTFSNSGKTPTTGTYINGEIADAGRYFTIMQASCEEAVRHTKIVGVGYENISIMPGGKHTLHDLAPDGPFGKPDILARLRGGGYIVGCVIYGSPFDDDGHRTGFAIPIKPKDDGSVSFGETITLLPN